MRKSIDGLSLLVEQGMDLSPFEPAVFVFANLQWDKVKLLLWELYAIEKRIRDLEEEARYRIRQQEAVPVIKAFRQWLDKALTTGVLPKGYPGKALRYLDNNWEALMRYTEAGHLAIDNNRAENAIRPFVIGRKNWLFNNTVAGAEVSANLYSLIETAKANGLEPYHYLKKVLTELPAATTVEQVEVLLPWNVRPESGVPVGFI